MNKIKLWLGVFLCLSLLLNVLFLIHFASRQSTSEGKENSVEEHEIDKAYSEAMKGWTGTTVEGIEISTTYALLWKEEATKYYDLLYDELDDDKKALLVSSQEKWENFFIENELLEKEISRRAFGNGSMRREFNASIPLYKYRERALELQSLYEMVTYAM
ncbi:MAG: hypothetical protein LBS21_10995 [Clostridiales bacterium]|jgi:hypothetical protein|nr:hypothetical protein [Clostridiales bacterium]